MSSEREPGRHGHRHAFAIWQAPELLFALTLAVLFQVTRPSGVHLDASRTGLTVFALASALCLLMPGRWLNSRVRLIVPALDLLGACLLNYDGPL